MASLEAAGARGGDRGGEQAQRTVRAVAAAGSALSACRGTDRPASAAELILRTAGRKEARTRTHRQRARDVACDRRTTVTIKQQGDLPATPMLSRFDFRPIGRMGQGRNPWFTD